MSGALPSGDPNYGNTEYHKAALRTLVGGVALPEPNPDPRAIPPPPVFMFLYSLKSRPLCALEEDDKCSICWSSFKGDAPDNGSDFFLYGENEVALVLPCCRNLAGSGCLKTWLDPIGRNGHNSCPYCRAQWFPRQADINSAAGQAQMSRIFEWFIQETKRRATDGPEEWKQDARDCLAQWENAKQQCQAIYHGLELQLARETLDMILRDIRPNGEPRDPNATPTRSLNTLDLLEAEIARNDPDWASNELYTQPEAIERGIDALDPEEGFHTLEPKIRQLYYRTIYLRLRLYDEIIRIDPRGGTERPELTDTERQYLERTRTDQPARYAEVERYVDEYGVLSDRTLIEHTENRLLLERQRDMLQTLAEYALSEAIIKLQEFGSVVARNSRGLPTREPSR